MEFAEHPKYGRFEDLTGQVFGRLKVLGFAGMLGERRPYQAHWYCECVSPNHPLKIITARANHLKEGQTKSCGCGRGGGLVELTGQQFGKWLVLGRGEKRRHWLCRCSCEKKTEREVHASSLKIGLSISCGCHRNETSAENMRKLQERMKVEGRASRTRHRGSYWPEYSIWTKMKSRCLNPDDPAYANYGGRGITLYEPWKDFAVFIEDVGRRPSPELSLDRIDNDGPYAPGNVRWATDEVQAGNTRRKRIEDFSEVAFLAEMKRRGFTA